jgi:hypothetical protein
MKKARTNTKPLSRTKQHPHQRIWAYRHSAVRADDLPMIATCFGITESDVVETALRLADRQ